MPRPKRTCPPGEMFHGRNRAVARITLFENAEDDDAFLRELQETWRRAPMPIYAFTALPDHWRFVVRPARRGQVSEFFRRLAVTHATRWHARYGTAGSGHLYQGRFKSFPVQGGRARDPSVHSPRRNLWRRALDQAVRRPLRPPKHPPPPRQTQNKS